MANTYRFGDSSRPGLLIGLGARQALPLIAGVLWSTLFMQFSVPAPVVWSGPAIAITVAFGRWRGAPLAEVGIPALRLITARRSGEASWVRTSLLGVGPGYEHDVPKVLAGIELLDVPGPGPDRSAAVAVVRDTKLGTVTAVLRAHGRGFPLSSPGEQDGLLASWGAALAPFARERSPVSRVVWHEWAHVIGSDGHESFLRGLGVLDRDDTHTRDYLALTGQQAQSTVAHEVLITLTVSQRRVRARRNVSPRAAAIEVLLDEVNLFIDRLASASLVVDPPLSPAELTALVRVWSDPKQAAKVSKLTKSLAAVTGRGSIEWGPMACKRSWAHAKVDGSLHRTYRVASWPLLPVGADWLEPLLTSAGATRTVTVVMEPVPTSRAARAADREVMKREADAEDKTQKGFRVSAQDRKRLADVVTREHELTEGHPEFRFVGIVDVCAPDVEDLDDAAARVEQSAAQALVDLRPLEARHDLGWVASLPLGRNVASTEGMWT